MDEREDHMNYPHTSAAIKIGRLGKCDFRLHGTVGSRLHAIIFPMPSLGKIIVADVGSLTGIKRTVNFPEGTSRTSSTLTDGRAFVLDINETAS
jgi:hypothetical protein